MLLLFTGIMVTQTGRTEAFGKTLNNELPYGLTGMSSDYVPTQKDRVYKKNLIDNNVIEDLKELAPGEDYVDREVIFTARDEEEAYAVARAYNAEVKKISPHLLVTLILPKNSEEAFRNYYENTEKLASISEEWSNELEDAMKEADTDHDEFAAVTVDQAVEAGADPQNLLPPVEPNYIIRLDPREKGGFLEDESEGGKSFDADPVSEADFTWWRNNLENPDPYAFDPTIKKDSEYNGKKATRVVSKYQYFHDMLGTYTAWRTTTGKSEVVVAVIDSGVDADHEELKGRVERKYDPYENDKKFVSHGTVVAGLIGAAMGNGKGGAGIAPGVTIYDYRIFDSEGHGTNDCDVEAIYQAVDDGAWIINMSLSGGFYSNQEADACLYAYEKGVAVIVSMGNDSGNIKKYPAAYDNVLAVASVNESGMRSYHSTYGPWCDIAAPGKNIFSSSNKKGVDGKYYEMEDGTSFATPIVAGAAALYMSKVGRVSPDEVYDKLKETAVKSPSEGIGAGIVNAAALLESAASGSGEGNVPASGIDIVVPNDENQVVAAGAAIDLKAALGSVYGNPTVSEVKWEIASLRSGKNGKETKKSIYKLVSIDPNGHLEVSKKFFNKLKAPYAIATVKATTTDGTDISDTQDIYIFKKAKKFYIAEPGKKSKTKKIKMETEDSKELKIITDLPEVVSVYNNIEIISSDPEIVGASTQLGAPFTLVTGRKEGDATLTIKLLDGSEKEYEVKVSVKAPLK